MPNKLADDRSRVSVAEDKVVIEQLKRIAKQQGKTLTDVYAEAARLLLAQKRKNKPTNEIKH